MTGILKVDSIQSPSINGDITLDPNGNGDIVLDANVGIGTAAPAHELHIQGSSTTASLSLKGSGTGTATSDGIELKLQGDNSAYLYNYENAMLRFGTNGLERMRLDNSGNVGIGTSPSVALHVKAGSGQIRLHEGNAADNKYGEIEVSNGKLILHSDKGNVEGSSDMRFNVDNGEKVRIDLNGTTTMRTNSGSGAGIFKTDVSAGTTYNLFQAQHSSTTMDNGTQCFFVTTNGNVYNTNGTYGTGSDQKLKENIVNANSQWDDIKALQIRNFNKIGNTDVHIGVVAQELEAAGMGGLVDEHADLDADGTDLGTVTKSVKYSILYMKAVKALQEAITKIETLETENNTQATQIADLITRVTALENA